MTETPKHLPFKTADRLMSLFCSPIGEIAIQMEIAFNHEIDTQRLASAVELIIYSEPILWCRLVIENKKTPYWERIGKDLSQAFILVNNKSEYEKIKTTPINIFEGPQLKACFLRSAKSGLLLLKVSHELADAISVKEIASTIADIYNTLDKTPEYKPKVNMKGAQNFKRMIWNLPFSIYPFILKNYLVEKWAMTFPMATHTLPSFDGADAPIGFVERTLPENSIKTLSFYGYRRDATLNDILLTAFIRAISKIGDWNEKDYLRICAIVDLRRYLPDNRNDTVCNLSSMEILSLKTSLGRDFDATLDKISAMMKKRKENWIGLNILVDAFMAQLIPFNWHAKLYNTLLQKVRDKKVSPFLLNNVGRIDPDSLLFDEIAPENAWFVSAALYPPFYITAISGYKGRLTFSSGVSDPEKRIPVLEMLYDKVVSELPL